MDDEMEPLLVKASGGDQSAFDRLFHRFRSELRQFIDVRLDRRLRSRFDASDVVQEAQLEAFRRLNEFLARRPMPFRVWLHKTAHQRLARLRRDHLKTAKRAADRERELPDQPSAVVVRKLVGAASLSPSQHLARREAGEQVHRALTELPEADREILLMRTVDGLSYDEAACILEIEPAAARKRYGRALLRLRRLVFAGADDATAS
jgi:RNA polymerase sigma-70 factor (ECF subfamily)